MHNDTAALRAIVRTALLTPSPLTRYQARPTRRAEFGDIVLTAGSDSRHVLVLGPTSPERLFAMAASYFEGSRDYSVEVEEGAAGAVERALLQRRWRLDEEEPALVLPDLPTTVPSLPGELRIHLVNDEAGLVDFHTVSAVGIRWVPSLAAATDANVALFVGYVGERPAATSRLVCLGHVADITSVNTRPEFRRRGHGTALTWAAVAEGARRGCNAAMLTATVMGYPVYVRMGFRPVCTFRTYLPPADRLGASDAAAPRA